MGVERLINAGLHLGRLCVNREDAPDCTVATGFIVKVARNAQRHRIREIERLVEQLVGFRSPSSTSRAWTPGSSNLPRDTLNPSRQTLQTPGKR
jgi:hypothetical protein